MSYNKQIRALNQQAEFIMDHFQSRRLEAPPPPDLPTSRTDSRCHEYTTGKQLTRLKTASKKDCVSLRCGQQAIDAVC